MHDPLWSAFIVALIGGIEHTYTGTTWQRWAQQGLVTQVQHQMVGVLNAINQRIPADTPPSARRVD